MLRWCDTRLAVQPALAGLKHCNRLEQVLARAEWNDAGIDEGLLRSSDDDVQSADAVLLCNAVRGILPVARLDARTWVPHPAVADLRRRLARAHPGFAVDQEVA